MSLWGLGKREDGDGASKITDEKRKKLLEIKLKINDARKKNLKAVYEEENRNSNPNYIKRLKDEKRNEYRKNADED